MSASSLVNIQRFCTGVEISSQLAANSQEQEFAVRMSKCRIGIVIGKWRAILFAKMQQWHVKLYLTVDEHALRLATAATQLVQPSIDKLYKRCSVRRYQTGNIQLANRQSRRGAAVKFAIRSALQRSALSFTGRSRPPHDEVSATGKAVSVCATQNGLSTHLGPVGRCNACSQGSQNALFCLALAHKSYPDERLTAVR